jgi:hypothetical protein
VLLGSGRGVGDNRVKVADTARSARDVGAC